MPGSSISVMSRSHDSVSIRCRAADRVELVRDLETAARTQHPGQVPAERGIVVDQQYAPVLLARLAGCH